MAFHFKQQQQQQQEAHLGGGTWITQSPATPDHQEGAIINGSGSGSNSSHTYGSGSGSGLTQNLHRNRANKPRPITLELFQATSRPNDPVILDDHHPLPFGWERVLDLPTGEIYYKKAETSSLSSSSSSVVMSQNRTTAPSLDLKLHLSPPRPIQHINMNNFPENNYVNESLSSATSSPSPTSSCLSSELNYHVGDSSISSTGRRGGREDSATTTSSTNMALVGCPNCLMYVMLSSEEQYPRCPKCKSSVLLDVLHAYHHNTKKTRNN